MFFQYFNQPVQFFTCVDRAGRIIRIREKQYATPPRDVLIELLGGELEIVLSTRLNDFESAPALRDDVREGEPERRRYQDIFITDGVEDVV